MKVLADGRQIQKLLIKLMRRHENYRIAVAWASFSFRPTSVLHELRDRIRQLVVGTHFYQTEADFLEAFMHEPGFRFVRNPSGVFHPKVYLLETARNHWDCILGSANLTRGGFGSNDEVCVHLSSEDSDAPAVHQALRDTIDRYYEKGHQMSEEDLHGYRVIAERMRKARATLSGTYDERATAKGSRSDGGKSPLEIEILKIPWKEFYRRVRHDELNSMKGRLELLQRCRTFFEAHDRFCEMDSETRRRIAGTTTEPADGEFDWRWFGSMTGAGNFKSVINQNDANLSLALDQIPRSGPVERQHYDAFLDHFRAAFVDKGSGAGGVATATRLLAMKRPDQFVCLDNENRKALCGAFGVPAS